MSFDSPLYVLFLGIVILLDRITPHRVRWILLLAASLAFYACWSPPLTLVILGVIILTYACAMGIERSESRGARLIWLWTAAAGCLGLLAGFKYLNFLAGTAAALFGGEWEPLAILLPVGCSFYTFQALAYVVDVYRRRLPAVRHIGRYALFIAFFPQLVAGPIERVEALLPQLSAERNVTRRDVREGTGLLLCGFFRKLVIADLAGMAVNRVFAAKVPDGSAVILALLLFSFQIYCDFAGYSQIAQGSARLLGIRLRDNFDRPYLACSMHAFWRRWHMSLTSWFTDYVYIPLGGNRHGKARQIAATLAVFLLSGLWHGAGWNFVLWGLWHGLLCSAEILSHRNGRPENARSIREKAGWLPVFALVTVSWLLFRAESLPQAAELLGCVFSPWNLQAGWTLLGLNTAQAACLLLGLAQLPLLERIRRGGRISPTVYAVLALCAVLAWFLRAACNGPSAFIYFQF